MRSLSLSALVALAVAFAATPDTGAQVFSAMRVTRQITEPVQLAQPVGDNDRLFVASNPGRVKIIKNGAVLSQNFLDITADINKAGEGGLLGLAFHPDYMTNGKFYVSFTADTPQGDSVVAQFTVSATNPDVADPGSRVDIFGPLPQTHTGHKAGALQFGPDGMLYFSIGDGGSSGDPDNRAQNLLDPRGKILRFDVDAPFPHVPADNPFVGNPNGLDEIWHYGLRNPYRFSIDPLTGDMFIADVGQSTREEVNYVASTTPAPVNFGWRCMEGDICSGLSGCTCFDLSLTDPVLAYPHSADWGCAVMGGHVYRGSAIPSLYGRYFFGDHCTSKYWSFQIVNGALTDLVQHTAMMQQSGMGFYPSLPTGFGTDNDGELYILDYYGDETFKLVPYLAWSDVGSGLLGSNGVPILNGLGTLEAGTDVTLTVTDVVPAASGTLVIGFSELAAPFKNGILYPNPDILISGLPTGAGSINLTSPWPAAVPSGLELFFQVWTPDAGAIAGFSATNGIMAITP